MKLTKLIIKNFRVIMRSRISSLIIIFGPLLIMLLAGFAFNNTANFDLNVGVFVPQQSSLTQDFVASLNNQFKLLTYTDDTNCIADVRNLKLHSCLVFSENFEIKDDSNNTITIFVDNSKVNIVDLIQNALNKVIVVQSTQIGADLAGVLVVNINDASKNMDTWRAIDIASLVTASKGVGATVDTDKNKWNSLNLDYTPKDPIISEVSAKQFAVADSINGLTGNANNAIDLAQNMIYEVDNAGCGNCSSIASAGQNELDIIEAAVNKANSNSTTNIAALQSAVTQVSNLVTEMASKISQTANLKTDLIKRFDTYKEQLAAIENQMNQLSAKMEAESSKLQNIKIKDASTIVSPVTTQVSPIVTSFSKLNYIFPSLMMLVIMFVCVMLSATIVVIEKLSPAKFRLFTTPTSDITFIMSNFVTTLVVATLQIILMICIAVFVFHIDVFSNIGNTALILFIGSIVFTLLGMCLGYIFANEQTTILGAISLGSAFILVSDLILPLESITSGLRTVIAQTPFVLLTGLLRRTILFGANVKQLGSDFYIVVIYCVSLFAVIVIAHKLLKVLYLVSNTKKGRKKAA